MKKDSMIPKTIEKIAQKRNMTIKTKRLIRIGEDDVTQYILSNNTYSIILQRECGIYWRSNKFWNVTITKYTEHSNGLARFSVELRHVPSSLEYIGA